MEVLAGSGENACERRVVECVDGVVLFLEDEEWFERGHMMEGYVPSTA